MPEKPVNPTRPVEPADMQPGERTDYGLVAQAQANALLNPVALEREIRDYYCDSNLDFLDGTVELII